MKRVALAVACSLPLAACAHTQFFEDAAHTREIGVTYYEPKPYLLVVNTGNAEKPTEVSVVYLPDRANPRYAKHSAGWGSSEFELHLANGIITSIGDKADSKGPETLTSLSQLAGSMPTLIGPSAGLVPQEGKRSRDVPMSCPSAFCLYEVKQKKDGSTTLLLVATRDQP